MGKAINCILSDDIYKKVIKHKTKMQHRTIQNISLTDAVEDLLELGLKK